MRGALPVKAPPLSSGALGANPARLRHEMAGTGFEIEEETRRFLLGGKAGSGPPDSNLRQWSSPWGNRDDVDSTCVYELPLCVV